MITTEMIIGSARYPSVGEFSLHSQRSRPLTVLKAKLPLAPVEQGMPVTLTYGYADPVEWHGTLAYAEKGGDLMTVTATGDGEMKLQNKFREAFVEESAEAIVRAALGVTGLPIAQIDAPGAQIGRYTAANIPVWEAVQQVEESIRKGYGITGYALWLGADGLRWTTGDEPGDVPVISSAENLIDHAPSETGLSKVTTFMLPGLTHSRRFTVQDTRRYIEGTFRAEAVEHVFRDLHARTHILYRRDV